MALPPPPPPPTTTTNETRQRRRMVVGGGGGTAGVAVGVGHEQGTKNISTPEKKFLKGRYHQHQHQNQHHDDFLRKYCPPSRYCQQPHCRRILLAVIITFLFIHFIGLSVLVDELYYLSSNNNEDDFMGFKQKQFFSSSHPHQHLPIVIVGGSDGSGTRAVVETLGSLGVPILSDDDQTLDIHASILFQKQGWPTLVQTVLQVTGGNLTMEFEDLPLMTQSILQREISKFQEYISRKYFMNQQKKRRKSSFGNIIQRRRNKQASSKQQGQPRQQSAMSLSSASLSSKVAFVIKAPATMLVLPLLWKFLHPIRFIHVVRE